MYETKRSGIFIPRISADDAPRAFTFPPTLAEQLGCAAWKRAAQFELSRHLRVWHTRLTK
jgi:hypothetical protein